MELETKETTMATRATFHFQPINEQDHGGIVYTHWDGYPEGAAGYLAATANFGQSKGSMIELFLRANPETTELTTGEHGDTEYRYTVKGNRITVHHRSTSGKSWTTINDCTLTYFVNIKLKHIISDRRVYFYSRLRSFDGMLVLIDKSLADAQLANENGWTGNLGSYIDEINRLALAMGGDLPSGVKSSIDLITDSYKQSLQRLHEAEGVPH